MKSKLKLISSMQIFGTNGIFVRNIPLPSSVIALARGCIGLLFLLGVIAVLATVLIVTFYIPVFLRAKKASNR